MKPKLCLYTDSIEPSGVGEHMLTLAAELSRRFCISFVCPQANRDSRFSSALKH
ncbi:MAG TPA: hypothetical protein VGP58_04165 [Pyrinomonadaceae bacterium]|nr:hypothetical protein [Pyrinomonadaceae bacterium]